MKPDIHVSLFLNGSNEHRSVDCSKYGEGVWSIEDYKRIIRLLQYGLKHCYKRISQLEAIKSEIDKLTR
jgi:hypothetical protein